MIDAELWYDHNPDGTSLYQGDVIDDVPVVFMPPVGKGWVLLRPVPPVTTVDALAGKTPKSFVPRAESALTDAWKWDSEYVLAKAQRGRVLVMTHMCDIERRSFLQVAPVYLSSELSGPKQTSLRANEIRYMFYLPSIAGVPESYADLSQAVPVHNSYLRGKGAVVRLHPRAITELQNKIADLQAREFGFNTDDSIPQDAEYVCANCFFRKATIQKQKLLSGRFPACHGCGADVLWVKLTP